MASDSLTGSAGAQILGGVDFVSFRYDKRIAEAPDESGTVGALAGLDERSLLEQERFEAVIRVHGELERRLADAAEQMASLTVGEVLEIGA